MEQNVCAYIVRLWGSQGGLRLGSRSRAAEGLSPPLGRGGMEADPGAPLPPNANVCMPHCVAGGHRGWEAGGGAGGRGDGRAGARVRSVGEGGRQEDANWGAPRLAARGLSVVTRMAGEGGEVRGEGRGGKAGGKRVTCRPLRSALLQIGFVLLGRCHKTPGGRAGPWPLSLLLWTATACATGVSSEAQERGAVDRRHHATVFAQAQTFPTPHQHTQHRQHPALCARMADGWLWWTPLALCASRATRGVPGGACSMRAVETVWSRCGAQQMQMVTPWALCWMDWGAK